MKKILLLSCLYISISVAQTDTLLFEQHKFVYRLSDKWQVADNSPSEGYLDVTYKRSPIRDSKGIEVIPNLLIKLIKVQAGGAPKSSKDNALFTRAALLQFAPPEVTADYNHSKNLASEFGLLFKNSYVFNSPYTDNFRAKHVCFYFTIYDQERYGVFLCLDSTEEVFKKIRSEVEEFIKSIKMI